MACSVGTGPTAHTTNTVSHCSYTNTPDELTVRHRYYSDRVNLFGEEKWARLPCRAGEGASLQQKALWLQQGGAVLHSLHRNHEY